MTVFFDDPQTKTIGCPTCHALLEVVLDDGGRTAGVCPVCGEAFEFVEQGVWDLDEPDWGYSLW